MPALFIVRSAVPLADRDAFDRWYEAEHLPDALAAFPGCRAARRGWAEDAPAEGMAEHLAFYEFETAAQVRALDGSAPLAAMVAEFDRNFGHVVRRRELSELSQSL